MPEYVLPPHVSESESAHRQFDGQWDDAADEDCVPVTLVMLANAAKPGVAQPTLTEAERLRDAAGYGPMGGTSVHKFESAMKSRYGLDMRVVLSATDDYLKSILVPGQGASIMGRLSNLAYGHKLRRFSPNFNGLHQVFVANIGPKGYWWMDPLGPKTGYSGEAVTWKQITKFFVGSAGLLPLAVIPPTATGESVSVLSIAAENPVRVEIPAGTKAFDLDGKAVKTLDKSWTRDALWRVKVGGVEFYPVRLPESGDAQVLLVKTADVKATLLVVNTSPEITALKRDEFNKGVVKAAAAAITQKLP